MKNKGFTLIELLAVIVILAIIALIATPIVMNIIKDSRKGAAERSAENYVKQVETTVASLYADPTKRLTDGTYYVMSDGNLCSNSSAKGTLTCPEGSTKVTIEMSGTKPTSGTVVIEDGKVVSQADDNTSETTTFTTNGYTFKLDINGKIIESKVWTYTDSNSNSLIDVGDIITVGTESFYIISNDGTNIKALAQYKLYVGNEGIGCGYEGDADIIPYDTDALGYGRQSSSMTEGKGTCKDSEAAEYATAYKDVLIELGANSNIETRLITRGELESLGAIFSTNSCGPVGFVSSLSYWIYDATNTTDSGDFASYGVCYLRGPSPECTDFGVRPIVVISSSDISK